MPHLVQWDFLPLGVLAAAAIAFGAWWLVRRRRVRNAPAWPALLALLAAMVIIGWTTAMAQAPEQSAWRERYWIPFLGVLLVIALVLLAIRNSKVL